MSFFFRKKKGNLKENGFADKVPDYFRQSVERRKAKTAGWLQEKTGGYSIMQKKTALIIFCILFGGFSFYILAGSVHVHGFGNRDLILRHLHSGQHPPPFRVIPDSVYQRAERTRQWLDSIRQYDSNRFRVILLSRPFLLNNLQLIEHIYQSQTK